MGDATIAFSTLMKGLTRDGQVFRAEVHEGWLQGRTLYGGLLAAYCLQCASAAFPDIPPLRSAQFAFVGPSSKEIALQPTILRRGRSTTFVGVDLDGDEGLSARATLCYGAPRQASRSTVPVAAPNVAPPTNSEPFPLAIPGLNFLRNFDRRSAGGHAPFTKSNDMTTSTWLKHLDDDAPDTTVSLVALADAALPAAMAFFDSYKPLNTMTWSLDVLTDRIENETGWWLVEVRAESLRDGYSSQTMTVWNAQREAVLCCRQHVAVFA
jgi:acyl-CoA thioesterase